MSKPLELTIYPKTCACFIDDEDGCRVVPLDCLMHGARVAEWGGQSKKRLTEPELAAEWWRSNQNFHNSTDGTESERRALAESITLHRFATHPHYFEATEPESDTE